MTDAAALIEDARGYARDTLNNARLDAQNYMNTIQGIADSTRLVPDSIKAVAPARAYIRSSTAPTYTAPNLDPPSTKPEGPPTLQDIENLAATVVGDVPVNTAEKPEYDAPEKPGMLESFTGNLPWVDTNLVLPSDPSWGKFLEPNWLAYQEVSKGNYTPPTFTQVQRPGDKPVADFDLRTDYEAAYRQGSEFLTVANEYVDTVSAKFVAFFGEIEGRLKEYMQGGTGLAPAVEDAIYARARSKNDAEARRVRDQALADAATRGFTMPNGALLSATQQARQAGADANATAAREIVVMQAELEQKNMQFAITAYSALRTTVVNATIQHIQSLVTINGQAMQFARDLCNQLIQVFDAQVKVYQMEVSLIDSDIKYTDMLLRAEMGKIQVYAAELDAEKTKAQANQSMASVYMAQLESDQKLAMIYKTKIDALIEKKRVERLKIELFQAQVQAYDAKSRAKDAEWRGFAAAVSGEESKFRAYQAEISGFSAEVEAFKAVVDAKKIGMIEAKARNDAQLSTYDQHIKLAMTEIQENIGAFKEKLALEEKKGVDWRWEQQAVAAENQIILEATKNQDMINLMNAKQVFEAELEKYKTQMSVVNPIAQISTTSVSGTNQIAAAALAGMNALAVQYADEAA